MARRKPLLAGVAVGVLATLELHGIRTHTDDGTGDGDTASELTRTTFRTDTRIGRAAFLAAYAAFTAWWLPHILDPARQPRRMS